MQFSDLIRSGKAVLAPMAGVSDLPFRELCSRFGAALVITEMVSSKALQFQDKKSHELMQLSAQESPAAIQIFGDDPAIMAAVRLPLISIWDARHPKSPIPARGLPCSNAHSFAGRLSAR